MKIYIDGHSFHYEMENLVRLFYPNEKITVLPWDVELPELPCVITQMKTDGEDAVIDVTVCFPDFQKNETAEVPLTD